MVEPESQPGRWVGRTRQPPAHGNQRTFTCALGGSAPKICALSEIPLRSCTMSSPRRSPQEGQILFAARASTVGHGRRRGAAAAAVAARREACQVVEVCRLLLCSTRLHALGVERTASQLICRSRGVAMGPQQPCAGFVHEATSAVLGRDPRRQAVWLDPLFSADHPQTPGR